MFHGVPLVVAQLFLFRRYWLLGYSLVVTALFFRLLMLLLGQSLVVDELCFRRALGGGVFLQVQIHRRELVLGDRIKLVTLLTQLDGILNRRYLATLQQGGKARPQL
jgi:hypothetical protein